MHGWITHIVVDRNANCIWIICLHTFDRVEDFHQGTIVDIVPINLEFGIVDYIIGNVVVCFLVATKLVGKVELDFLDHCRVEAVERDGQHLDSIR